LVCGVWVCWWLCVCGWVCVCVWVRVCVCVCGYMWTRDRRRELPLWILSVFFRKNDIPRLFHFRPGSGAGPKMIKAGESITVPALQPCSGSLEFDTCA